MIRRRILTGLLVLALAGVTIVPMSAQFFGVVFDPTNYANALLRYAQLQQQLTQLITTYQQIRTQYLLLLQQSQLLPVNMAARYQSLAVAVAAVRGAECLRHDDALDSDREHGPGRGRRLRARHAAAARPTAARSGASPPRKRRASGRAMTALNSPTAASRTGSKPWATCAAIRRRWKRPSATSKTTPTRPTPAAIRRSPCSTRSTRPASRRRAWRRTRTTCWCPCSSSSCSRRRTGAKRPPKGINAHIAFLNRGAGRCWRSTTAQTTAALTTLSDSVARTRPWPALIRLPVSPGADPRPAHARRRPLPAAGHEPVPRLAIILLAWFGIRAALTSAEGGPHGAAAGPVRELGPDHRLRLHDDHVLPRARFRASGSASRSSSRTSRSSWPASWKSPRSSASATG